MRPARLAALLTASLIAVAACAGNTVPPWTYAPASAQPAVAASGSPGASGGTAASGAPASGGAAASGGTVSGSAAASGGPSTVEIDASGIQFTTQNVTAPAGAKFSLTFNNQDSGIPHDVQIKDAAGAEVFKTDILTGPTQKSYDVGPLQPGSYPFVCTIHPNMTGTLTVQ